MYLFIRKIIKCAIRAVNDTIYHNGLEFAGYLSFLFMNAFFPFFILLLISVNFFGGVNLVSELINLILNAEWTRFIEAFKPRILEIANTPPSSLLSIALLGAIWTTSSLFEGLRTVLNRAYRVHEPPHYLWRRAIAILEFCAMIFIILCFMFIMVIAPKIWYVVASILQHSNKWTLITIISPEFEMFRSMLILIFQYLTISGIYKFIPSKKQDSCRWTAPGSLSVMIGWNSFSYLFNAYLLYYNQFNAMYGPIASIMVSMFYFYVCGILLIFGAEFNYHAERVFNSGKSREHHVYHNLVW